MNAEFSSDEASRYARQLALGLWGAPGQRAVRAGHATLPGQDAGTATAALYLAGAGLGSLAVEPSLHADLRALNPHVELTSVAHDPAEPVIRPADQAAGLPSSVIGDDPAPELLGVLAANALLMSLLPDEP